MIILFCKVDDEIIIEFELLVAALLTTFIVGELFIKNDSVFEFGNEFIVDESGKTVFPELVDFGKENCVFVGLCCNKTDLLVNFIGDVANVVRDLVPVIVAIEHLSGVFIIGRNVDGAVDRSGILKVLLKVNAVDLANSILVFFFFILSSIFDNGILSKLKRS